MADLCSSVGVSRAFKQLNSDQKTKILQNTKPVNTKNATKTWLKCFNDYLKSKQLGNIIEEIATDELANIFFDFWAELVPTEASSKKKIEGINKENNVPRYANTTLKCIRAAINRHLKKNRSIDIMKDPRFTRSNEMFKAMQKEGKRQGKGSIKHKSTISQEDFQTFTRLFLTLHET